MPIGRVIAAANVAADPADAQVYPPAPGFQALLAAFCAGLDLVDLVEMGTLFFHGDESLGQAAGDGGTR